MTRHGQHDKDGPVRCFLGKVFFLLLAHVVAEYESGKQSSYDQAENLPGGGHIARFDFLCRGVKGGLEDVVGRTRVRKISCLGLISWMDVTCQAKVAGRYWCCCYRCRGRVDGSAYG